VAVKLRKARKFAVGVLAGVALIAIFLVLQRNRVTLLERMLVQFVESRTEGRYHLEVEELGFDLTSLTYHVRNITITPTDTVSTGPVRKIHIPFVHARMSSFGSLLSRELQFSKVSVAEPTISLSADGTLRREHITIGQVMVTAFPAVESVLKFLGIETLRVERATLSVEEPNKHVIHVRLIDLLAEHWAEHTEGEGDVRLGIGGQSVDLSQASFSFSEVEYTYSKERIIFKDFNFQSYDSASQSRVSVEGKSVLIRKLDFNELYNNQRYRLDKIEIAEPKFSGSLRARTQPRPDDRIRLPLSAILTQTFGEIRVDTAMIQDASFQMVLVFDEDSVRAHIPDVNLSLHNVEVLSDTTDILFGDLQMDLAETNINLNDNVRLSCNTMLFERNEDITISNVSLTGASGERFVTCESIGFKNFRLFEFIAGRELRADSIAIGNAVIHVTRDLPGLFPSFTDTRSTRNKRPVHIAALSLRNVNLQYENSIQHLSLTKLDANARNITDLSWRSMVDRLNSVQIGTLVWQDGPKNVRCDLRNVHLTPGRASVTGGTALIDSLDIEVSNLRVTHPLSSLLRGNYRYWQAVNVGNLRVHGKISPADTSGLTVDRLAIGRLDVDVRLGTQHLSTRMGNISGLSVGSGIPQRLKGTCYGLALASENAQFEVDSAVFDTEGQSQLYNLTMSDKDMRLAMSYAEASGLALTNDNYRVERLFARQLRVEEPSWSLSSDSVLFSGVDLSTQTPAVQRAELFVPVLYRDFNEEATSMTTEFLDVPRISELVLHDGQLRTEDRQYTLTGLSRLRLRDGIAMEFERLSFTLSNHDVELHEVRIDGSLVNAGVMKARPRPLPPDAHETDVISGEWQSVMASGLMVDDLIQSQNIIADTIIVNGLVLDVVRDKRLEDPEPVEKDFAISDLIANSGIAADIIRLRDGSVWYAERSETTGEEGSIWFDQLDAEIRNPDAQLFEFNARARVYGQAPIAVAYEKTDASSFHMEVDVGGMDLMALNHVLRPLQSIELKSGYLDRFRLEAIATRDSARGRAEMSYRNLHMTLLNKTDPDKKWLGQDIVSFVANGILRHNREPSWAPVEEIRIPEKSVFNYWKRIAVNGALNVVKKGKKVRR
jgi:hypothetical protein